VSPELADDLLELGLLVGIVGAVLLAAIVLVAVGFWTVAGAAHLYRFFRPSKESS
jgi:hypothetical protein